MVPPAEDESPRNGPDHLWYWRGHIDSELKMLTQALSSLRTDLGHMEGRTEQMVEGKTASLRTAMEQQAVKIDAQTAKVEVALRQVEDKVQAISTRIAGMVGGVMALVLVLQYVIGPLLIKAFTALTKGP